MTRKRCNRKVWPLLTDPIRHAIEGVSLTPQALLDRLRLAELSAIESFARGNATPDDFRTLADVLNVCETLCRQGIGGVDAQAAVDAGHAALLAIKARHDRTGRLALAGPELAALRDLHAWHDAQREAIPRAAFERATQKTHDYIRSAHPGVRVLD